MPANKYATLSRSEALDKEILELESKLNPVEGGPEPIVVAPVIEQAREATIEQVDWEKRYADLRRYNQQVKDDAEKTLQERATELAASQARIKALESKDFPQPKTKEELLAWMKEVPDAAGMIRTLVQEETSGSVDSLAQKNKKLEEDIEVFKREKAEIKLLRAHADFDDIKKSPEFRDWVIRQPQERGRIGQSLFDALNGWDADEAIHAVNVYKSDMEKKTNKPKTETREAAAPVIRHSGNEPEASNRKLVFKESDLESMPIRDYIRLEKAIEEARMEGRIEYDLTAGAR